MSGVFGGSDGPASLQCLDLMRIEAEDILVSEEKHLDWLETQLGLIRQLGEPMYCAQQL